MFPEPRGGEESPVRSQELALAEASGQCRPGAGQSRWHAWASWLCWVVLVLYCCRGTTLSNDGGITALSVLSLVFIKRQQ